MRRPVAGTANGARPTASSPMSSSSSTARGRRPPSGIPDGRGGRPDGGMATRALGAIAPLTRAFQWVLGAVAGLMSNPPVASLELIKVQGRGYQAPQGW